MTFTKIDPADLDSPRRELSNGGLKSVVALLVRWQIDSLSARIGRSIQMYHKVAPRPQIRPELAKKLLAKITPKIAR